MATHEHSDKHIASHKRFATKNQHNIRHLWNSDAMKWTHRNSDFVLRQDCSAGIGRKERQLWLQGQMSQGFPHIKHVVDSVSDANSGTASNECSSTRCTGTIGTTAGAADGAAVRIKSWQSPVTSLTERFLKMWSGIRITNWKSSCLQTSCADASGISCSSKYPQRNPQTRSMWVRHTRHECEQASRLCLLKCSALNFMR